MKASASKLVRTILLCEDVRQEINGKFMIAGIYSNDIKVKEFPANLALMMYAQVDMQMLRIANKVYFRFFADRIKPLRMEVDINSFKSDSEDVTSAVFVVPRFIAKLDGPNFINFDVSINQKNWHRLFRKKVSHGPVTEGFI